MDNFPENNNNQEEPNALPEPEASVNDTASSPSDNSSHEPSPELQAPTPPPLYPFEEKKKHWLTVRDVKPEKGYNPYKDQGSVFKEIYEENPSAYQGSYQLESENEYQYYTRRYAEYKYTKSEAKKKLRNSSSFAALLVFIFIMFSIGLQMALVFVIPALTQSIEEAAYDQFINNLNNILNAIQYIVMFPLVFIVGTVGRKCKCKTFFQPSDTSPLFTFRWCIISLGSTYIVAMIFDAIFSILEQMGMNINDLSSELPTSPHELAIYGLFSVICAPIFEEIMFRGVMLNRLKKFGGLFASIVSGVFFGLIHQNHAQMFYATALGIIFAIITLKSNSIIPSILAHMTVNGYSFINTLLASPTNYNEVVFGDGSVTELDGPVWALFGMGLMNVIVYLAMAAAIVLLIIEFIKFPETFKLSKGDSMLTSGEKAKAFFTSPVVIITLLVLAFVIYTNSFMPIDALSNALEDLTSSLPTE